MALSVSNLQAFEKLETYVKMIEAKNAVMNLTGFTGDRLWQEGIYESIVSLYEVFKNPGDKTLVDIGAGAGFPSVPFKIVFPEIKLSIIEPQRKRIAFLEEVSKQLRLDVELIVARAEDVKKFKYDLLTARAVAPLCALLEISSHLGKIGAHYAFLKGPSVFEEVLAAKSIISKLKISGEALKINNEFLAREAYVFDYKKIVETPDGLPRPWAKIVTGQK